MDVPFGIERPVPEWQLDESVLHVERVEVHDHHQQIQAVLRALAVAQELGVVGGMESQPRSLQGGVRALISLTSR